MYGKPPHIYVILFLNKSLEYPNMTANTKSDARLNIRLPGELKQVIEQAAAQLGQSISDFAIATLVQNARAILQQHDITELSQRDRDIFINMLEDGDAKPNLALTRAAERYKSDYKDQ
jgi:uncharacterized protein (DUF1778 family)